MKTKRRVWKVKVKCLAIAKKEVKRASCIWSVNINKIDMVDAFLN